MSDSSPKNPAALRHDAPWTSPRQAQPGEKLFEFLRGHDRFLCELHDHGQHCVEVQFYQNEEFLFSRRFEQAMSRTQTPREIAVQWAEEERKALEQPVRFVAKP